MTRLFMLVLIIYILIPESGNAQLNNDKLGAWYMYFITTNFNNSQWGFQGDVQYRNWNIGGDLEQLLISGGLTFSPKSTKINFGLGYTNVHSGAYGKNNLTTMESRIYQDAMFPVQLGNRIYANHRFRFEQRFVENQNLRTRYRYRVGINVPLNKTRMERKTIYLAFYDEIFINGQRNIGNGNHVEIFDRNRLYMAIGYFIQNGVQVRLGVMNQSTNSWKKNQLQVSLHHRL